MLVSFFFFCNFFLLFPSVAILNVKPILCLCVSPLSSSVLLSDKKCENRKAKNNIKKARLAPWWKAVMTMDEWERTESVCVWGGEKKKKKKRTRANGFRPNSVIADIHSLCFWHRTRNRGRRGDFCFHKKKKKKGRTQRLDLEITATQQALVSVDSVQTQAGNWAWANVSLQYLLEEAASWLYSCCCRDLNYRYVTNEATLLKRKALGKTERSPKDETAEMKLCWVTGLWHNTSQWLSFFFFPPLSLNLSTAARWQTH